MEVLESKFNLKSLEPYSKVLIRDNNKSVWKGAFFSDIFDYVACNKYIRYALRTGYCIPYNNETKYLLGTTDEAPEFYCYWK